MIQYNKFYFAKKKIIYGRYKTGCDRNQRVAKPLFGVESRISKGKCFQSVRAVGICCSIRYSPTFVKSKIVIIRYSQLYEYLI